ncbi:MAG: ATP-binding protein [Conexivisphaera sp.]
MPHDDILKGKLTMDVFAADLWETYVGRAPPEYSDPELFFRKTYITSGLQNLLDVVKKRLTGKGGDPVIQIQTPFGGGKTHALIALYHRAKEWNAKSVVMVGSALSTDETPWGLVERQLTGANVRLTGRVSPGREALRQLLEVHQPVLILIDEILEYATKASGVPVGETSLAAQVLAFMQELTEVAGTLDRVCVVVTLPSSLLEHYDANSERLFQQLQKISGRVERIYTPIQENEISKVVRRRLFSGIDETRAKSVVSSFIEYAEREGILPEGVDVSVYREQFLESYPFIPDVIDVLYKRWGSFPSFQRTRGVLRLLSLVIYSLYKNRSERPYITLSDFDLSDQEIRRELIKHIGPEFDSVIAADITGADSGSRRVDDSIGKSYRGLRMGTRAATSIFLYSFSGAEDRGANLREVKRNVATIGIPSSVVSEAVEDLATKLFYLQSQNGRYYFLNQPNLNRILLTKMENIKDDDVDEFERKMLQEQISGDKFRCFIWPNAPKDVPDTRDLKLVILPNRDVEFMKNVLESKGDSPRVYRNTIFFLCPTDEGRSALDSTVRKIIAYGQILNDKTLGLTEEQRKEASNKEKEIKGDLGYRMKDCYRLAYAPTKDGLEEINLGMPTYGENSRLDEWVYEGLREMISEKLSPIVIKERYLKDGNYVKTSLIYESMLTTPGEKRPVSLDSFKRSISDGVRSGVFGLGELTGDGNVTCKYFSQDAEVTLDENEVIIKDAICKAQTAIVEERVEASSPKPGMQELSEILELPAESSEKRIMKEYLSLEFEIPEGQVSQVMGMMNFLQHKFKKLKIRIEATDGSISNDEYENKVKETLRQLGVEIHDD